MSIEENSLVSQELFGGAGGTGRGEGVGNGLVKSYLLTP